MLDVLPLYWKKRVEHEEKKRAKKRLAVHIMSLEDQHPRIMEYFRRNLGDPDRMISMKNSVFVHVFRDTAGGRLLRLKRCGKKEVIADVWVNTGAQVSLVRKGFFSDEILKPSRRPARLKGGNGKILCGGTHEATIGMEFC